MKKWAPHPKSVAPLIFENQEITRETTTFESLKDFSSPRNPLDFWDGLLFELSSCKFVPSLKLIAKSPWKWMLGRWIWNFLLGLGLFSRAFAVSFRPCNFVNPLHQNCLPHQNTSQQRAPSTISRVQISCSWRENFLHHQRSWNWFGPWIVNSLVKAFRWTRVICYQEVAWWNDFSRFLGSHKPWVFFVADVFFLGSQLV